MQTLRLTSDKNRYPRCYQAQGARRWRQEVPPTDGSHQFPGLCARTYRHFAREVSQGSSKEDNPGLWCGAGRI